jgi:hypothetical protein
MRGKYLFYKLCDNVLIYIYSTVLKMRRTKSLIADSLHDHISSIGMFEGGSGPPEKKEGEEPEKK